MHGSASAPRLLGNQRLKTHVGSGGHVQCESVFVFFASGVLLLYERRECGWLVSFSDRGGVDWACNSHILPTLYRS
jgi:hypothetical protein